MKIDAKTPEEYIEIVPPERQEAVSALRKVILDNLPEGFQETIGYGMIGYVVPFSLYPDGYHADHKLPLPFMNLGSQKNYIVLHHIGLYSNNELLTWFLDEYQSQTKRKPDMGKGCVRFKNPDQIPYKLIGELVSRVSAREWIKWYESNLKK
jgi:hypothetical protein